MELYKMSIEEVLRGLEFVERGYDTVVYGNDKERTIYIKNITKSMFEKLSALDIKKLDKDIIQVDSYEEYKAIEIVKIYIIPKIEKAKKRYEKYGF